MPKFVVLLTVHNCFETEVDADSEAEAIDMAEEEAEQCFSPEFDVHKVRRLGAVDE